MGAKPAVAAREGRYGDSLAGAGGTVIGGACRERKTISQTAIDPMTSHPMIDRLFRLLPVACLLLLGAATPTPKATGPQIILTPINGAPSVFELIRVEGETVEVRKEGVRLQFSRAQIKSARNAEAEALIDEASRTLAEVEIQDMGRYEALAGRLDRQSKALRGAAARFSWLIPAASSTLVSVNQALADVQASLDAVGTLRGEGDRLEQMARGSIPLDATWEESFSAALEQANSIPYPSIRKEIVDRLVGLRREIRLDLAKGAQASADRVVKLDQELRDGLATGELTETRASLLLKEMRRYAIKIPDAERRTEMEALITGNETLVASSMERLARAREEKAARTLLEGLVEAVGKANSQQGIPDFSARLEEARQAAGGIADPTSEGLTTSLEEVSQQFSALPAEPPKPATSAVTSTQPEPQPIPAIPKDEGGMGSLLAHAKEYAPEFIRPHLSNLWLWNGILALVLITPKRWVVPSRQRRGGGSQDQPIPVTEGTGTAPHAEDEDLFGAPIAALAPAAVTASVAAPPVTAPKAEDVFGFGPSDPLGPEDALAPPPPAAHPVVPVVTPQWVVEEEDPFAVVDEVFSTAPSTDAETLDSPEGSGSETTVTPGAKEEDPFGFGDTPVESILTSGRVSEPPSPETGMETKTLEAGNDLFGFGATPLEDPAPSEAQTVAQSPEEDPFGFGSDPVMETPESPPPARTPEAPAPSLSQATPEAPASREIENLPLAPAPDLSLVTAEAEDDLLSLDPFGYETDPETLLPHEVAGAISPTAVPAPSASSEGLDFDVEDPFGLIQGSGFVDESPPTPLPRPVPPADVLDEEDPFGLGKDSG